MITSEHIGKVISFETYAQSLIGKEFKRCKVLGILDLNSAMKENDVAALAVAIYPSLPKGTLKDYREYQYVKVRLVDGVEMCIANQWIKDHSIEVYEDVTATFTVSGISASDVDLIVRILASYNFKDVVPKVV